MIRLYKWSGRVQEVIGCRRPMSCRNVYYICVYLPRQLPQSFFFFFFSGFFERRVAVYIIIFESIYNLCPRNRV